MTPRENCYISSYKGPNEISEDVLEREQTLISLVKFLDPEDETVTRDRPYNFAVLNSPVTGHLGKRIINPNWWNQLWWNLWCWNRDRRGYLSAKFQIQRSSNFRDTIETVSGISVKEIGKLGLPAPGASLHCFQKGVHWTTLLQEIYLSIQSDMKYSKFWKLGFL